MAFEDYKIILYKQADGSFVAEIPCLPACYALSTSRAMALDELRGVFAMVVDEYRSRNLELPQDTTEILND
jgi:predicted RNase H-like HicB family nuclease